MVTSPRRHSCSANLLPVAQHSFPLGIADVGIVFSLPSDTGRVDNRHGTLTAFITCPRAIKLACESRCLPMGEARPAVNDAREKRVVFVIKLPGSPNSLQIVTAPIVVRVNARLKCPVARTELRQLLA